MPRPSSSRPARWLPLLLLPLAGALDPCCGDTAQQLSYDTPVRASVSPGSWSDFYVVAADEGYSLAFTLDAASTQPMALGAYLYEGVLADSDTPSSDRCVLCSSNGVPTSTAGITTASTVRPSGQPAMNAAALDMDTVSKIGNSTHRRYYLYVGTCYLMKGSVYYLSVYGQTSSTVSFSVTVSSINSQLPITTSADAQVTTGQVCDAKYMHYFFDWGSLHPGGMQLSVKTTSGGLDSFSLRKEKCAGVADADIADMNLFGYGLTEGKVKLPGHGYLLEVARYYIAVRGAPELCGDYTIAVRNLTQSEFHTAT